MALTCSTNRFVLAPAATAGWFWYWDRNERYINSAFFLSVDDYYELPDFAVIGATNYYDPNQVHLMVKIPLVGPVNFPAQGIVLQSTSGDTNNKLLSASVSGYVLTVKMWALTAKEVTTLTFAMPQVYNGESPAELFPSCFTNYQLPLNEVVSAYCDGFVRTEIKSDGAGGVTITQTANSEACGYVAPLEAVVFTETKEVEYRRGCFKNPMYLTWKNLKGGWDSWLFQNNQLETVTTESLGEFFRHYESIADLKSTSTEIGKLAKPTITLSAEYLTLDEKRNISKILYSNKVYILDSSGEILKEVKVSQGSFLIEETKKSLFSIDFQIELPQINTIRN